MEESAVVQMLRRDATCFLYSIHRAWVKERVESEDTGEDGGGASAPPAHCYGGGQGEAGEVIRGGEGWWR